MAYSYWMPDGYEKLISYTKQLFTTKVCYVVSELNISTPIASYSYLFGYLVGLAIH